MVCNHQYFLVRPLSNCALLILFFLQAAIEIEQTIRRLASHRGVEGLVIFTADGVAFRSTLSRELTKQYSGLIAQLVAKARSTVRTIDPDVSSMFYICTYVPRA